MIFYEKSSRKSHFPDNTRRKSPRTTESRRSVVAPWPLLATNTSIGKLEKIGLFFDYNIQDLVEVVPENPDK